jgi:hypothetical protein
MLLRFTGLKDDNRAEPGCLHPPSSQEFQMNRTFTTVAVQSAIAAAIIAAAPLAAAGSAAQGATYVDPGRDHVLISAPFVSTVSREQVRAEAVAAARQPLLFTDSQNQPAQPAFASTVSRAQVHAEAVEATRLRVTSFTDSQHRPLTPAQAEQIRSAGLRAVNGDTMAAAKQ